MAWIESHTVLLRHRKTKELALALNIKAVHVIGHLTALWHTALEQQEDGDLSLWSPALIAEAAAYEGNAEIFVEHLKNINWIEKNGLIHDWLDYAGHYLTKKYSSNYVFKLKKIWALHGRKYGQKQVHTRRPVSDPKATLPNLPNHTIPNHTNLNTNVRFEDFWKEYPVKVKKDKAKEAWGKCIKAGIKPEAIIAGVLRGKNSAEWQKDGGQFIPHPTTFLNGKRWEDEYASVGESTADRIRRIAEEAKQVS